MRHDSFICDVPHSCLPEVPGVCVCVSLLTCVPEVPEQTRRQHDHGVALLINVRHDSFIWDMTHSCVPEVAEQTRWQKDAGRECHEVGFLPAFEIGHVSQLMCVRVCVCVCVCVFVCVRRFVSDDHG